MMMLSREPLLVEIPMATFPVGSCNESAEEDPPSEP
jgi:hypothetical protein